MKRNTITLLFIILIAVGLYSANNTEGIKLTVQRLMNQGDYAAAMQALRGHLRTNDRDIFAYEMLARVQCESGQIDAGLETIDNGLRISDDAGLIELQARIWDMQARDGLSVSYSRGMVRYSGGADAIREAQYKKERAEKALHAFLRLSKKRTDYSYAFMRAAELMNTLGRHEESLRLWETSAGRFPDEAGFAFGEAKLLTKLHRDDEAAVLYQKTIELDPRVFEAYESLAEYHQRNNRSQDARDARERADFYKWLPRFSNLRFSSDNYATMKLLYVQEDSESPETNAAVSQQKRSAAITGLMKENSKRSSEFLAALCYHHMDCGDRESEMFDELGRRWPHTSDALRGLLEQHQSTCTARQAVAQLARKKAPGIFDWIVSMLPMDTNPLFSMDLATALEEYGDPGAVDVLVSTMQPGKPLHRRDRTDNEDITAGFGRMTARIRAALALGAFNKPQARAALEQGLDDPDFAIYCQAALYRMVPDDARGIHIRECFNGQKKTSSSDLMQVLHYLQRTAPDFARTLPDEETIRKANAKKSK